MREIPADDGEIILAKGKTIGYLAQHQALLSGNTIYQEVESAKADLIQMETQLRRFFVFFYMKRAIFDNHLLQKGFF